MIKKDIVIANLFLGSVYEYSLKSITLFLGVIKEVLAIKLIILQHFDIKLFNIQVIFRIGDALQLYQYITMPVWK